MDAIVTGSAGFIGSHLAFELAARGHQVVGIDRRSRPAGPGYRHVTLDLADDPRRTGLHDLILRADAVFHLAGRPGVRDGFPGADALRRRDNIVSTRNVLAVTPATVPVVVVSSSSVYGSAGKGRGPTIPSREEDWLRPRGGYARSKAEMESLCRQRRDQGGHVAVIRPFTVAGERQRPDMAFSRWLQALHNGDPLVIFGSPGRSRDVTDVRHVVEGLIRVVERGINETVNLGTGVGHRLIDLARTLMSVSGQDGEVLIQPGSKEEVEATLADTTRCRRLLGFVPHTDLAGLLGRQVMASSPTPARVAS